ncbi:MAG: hypothetical protein AB1714_29810 [Acidobacteriota bacterium]
MAWCVQFESRILIARTVMRGAVGVEIGCNQVRWVNGRLYDLVFEWR